MGLLSRICACLRNPFASATAADDDGDDDAHIHGIFFELRTLQVATNFFSELNLLGHGGFGPVYKAWMLDELVLAIDELVLAILWICILNILANTNSLLSDVEYQTMPTMTQSLGIQSRHLFLQASRNSVSFFRVYLFLVSVFQVL
ncbi:hypothetical protein ACFE04_005793 [Oxalis oulophora]